MTIDCEICGAPIELPAHIRDLCLQSVDGPLRLYYEIDARPLRDHLLTHGGGGGGEPLPAPDRERRHGRLGGAA